MLCCKKWRFHFYAGSEWLRWTRLDAVGRGWTRLDAVCSVTDNSDSHRFLGSVGSVGTELRAPYSYSTPYIITKYEKLYGA